MILKSTSPQKCIRTAKNILIKTNSEGKIALSTNKIYNKDVVIKIVWFWHQIGLSSEKEFSTQKNLVYDKCSIANLWGERWIIQEKYEGRFGKKLN